MLNLTPHSATAEQRAAGVIDLADISKMKISMMLTFDTCPTRDDVNARAKQLVANIPALQGEVDHHPQNVLIGGAPFFMGALENALLDKGYTPFYAFSTQSSVEVLHGGVIIKTSIFMRSGFVPASFRPAVKM